VKVTEDVSEIVPEADGSGSGILILTTDLFVVTEVSVPFTQLRAIGIQYLEELPSQLHAGICGHPQLLEVAVLAPAHLRISSEYVAMKTGQKAFQLRIAIYHRTTRKVLNETTVLPCNSLEGHKGVHVVIRDRHEGILNNLHPNWNAGVNANG
jgi:hypothetical protein